MRIRPRVWMAAVLLGGVFPSVSGAAATVTFDASPPAGGGFALACDLADPDPDGYPWTHGSGTSLGVGQTFVLGQAAVIDKLTFRLRQDNQLSGEGASLTFFEGNGATRETLAVHVGLLPIDLPVGQNVYVTYDFPDLAFSAGVGYGFLLEISGGGNVNDASGTILHMTDDQCVAGSAFQTGGAATTVLPQDLAFYLHSANQVTDSTLLLHDGRFSVTVSWRDSDGKTGFGTPVGLTSESGYFWFFDRGNVEVVVKVLHACSYNDRYWVFAAGLTDVETEIEVVDLEHDVAWSSTSTLGQPFVTITDTDAFDTCP